MHIIEDENDLGIFLHALTTEPLYMHAVCADMDKHASNNGVSLIFFYLMTKDEYWCIPVKHNECIVMENVLEKIKQKLSEHKHTKFVSDKKSMLQLFGVDLQFVDVDIYNFLENGTVPDDTVQTTAHDFVRRNFPILTNLNICIPIYKHAKLFIDKVEKIKKVNYRGINEKDFCFTNNTMTSLFARLESNGLCVTEDFTDAFGEEQKKHIKGNLVFSQYNLLTSTGRPSNRFGGVNYAALNKNDGSRNCFVSRYGDDGMLVMMDYNAFHPRLIAHLVNFHMDANENPYSYLAKYYFNKPNPTEEDIAAAKQYTFTQLYGGIESKWMHIPYLRKIQEYIDHRWRFFEANGLVETPKYGRKIKGCHIDNPTPNKLFNYILQAFETEMAVDVLGDLLGDLNGKKTVPILYTYDSILFDAHKEDKIDTIKRLKKIMERDKFPVKVYVGKNYGDMKQVVL